MKKGLIIISGGMDSVTLLHDYKDDIALAISFDYGSKHNKKEIPFAKLNCDMLGIKHDHVWLSPSNRPFTIGNKAEPIKELIS